MSAATSTVLNCLPKKHVTKIYLLWKADSLVGLLEVLLRVRPNLHYAAGEDVVTDGLPVSAMQVYPFKEVPVFFFTPSPFSLLFGSYTVEIKI